MRVARAFDAEVAGRPYCSANLPRLTDPERRSLVVGYLATAVLAGPRHRTDGTWVWPAALAEQVGALGVGPPAGLLDHIAAQGYRLPAAVPEDLARLAAEKADHPPVNDPSTVMSTEPSTVTSTAFLLGGGDDPATTVLVRRTRDVRGVVREEWFGPYGWRVAGELGERADLAVVPDPVAARVADQLCAHWHAVSLASAQESVASSTSELRVARLFDRQTPDGRPWFSPNRLRIVEPHRRERVAAYLERGRLVLRAAGQMADPLVAGGPPVVPLHYRTDGRWVWPQALAYYLRQRGMAPELELLCRIEASGGLPPEPVSEDLARAAAAMLTGGPVTAGLAARPPATSMTYFADAQGRNLARVRRPEPGGWDRLSHDLRWRIAEAPWTGLAGNGDRLVETTEAGAAHLLDERWVQASNSDETASVELHARSGPRSQVRCDPPSLSSD
ncbi:MAG TPA: hypothetical protein VF163_16905 [Micromonosporaceae bacterium]